MKRPKVITEKFNSFLSSLSNKELENLFEYMDESEFGIYDFVGEEVKKRGNKYPFHTSKRIMCL